VARRGENVKGAPVNSLSIRTGLYPGQFYPRPSSPSKRMSPVFSGW